jgi:hypothetical protein
MARKQKERESSCGEVDEEVERGESEKYMVQGTMHGVVWGMAAPRDVTIDRRFALRIFFSGTTCRRDCRTGVGKSQRAKSEMG